ncbi:hypothetical protein M9458_024222, partial [Cirrhinus mrigala]
SGWNDVALKVAFKKGLNVKLQAELACKAVDLPYKEYITLTIKMDNLMRENLYYYCEEENHCDAACPHKAKKSSTTSYSASTIEVPTSPKLSFLLKCELFFDAAYQCVSALVDSGSAVNVINQELLNKLKTPTSPCVPAITITTIYNGSIGSGITAITQPITLHIGLFHKETINFFVVPSCKYEVILGHPWLAIHDPVISWNQGELIQWSAHCQRNCLKNTLSFPCLSTSVESPEVRTQTTLPPVYAQSKVWAATEWPHPKTIKELQRFLGFTNFYHRFIHNYSLITAPLTLLLKGKPAKLKLNYEAVNSFESLKTCFTTAPVLKHPDPELPFMVEVDALDCGIDAVLSQRHSIP